MDSSNGEHLFWGTDRNGLFPRLKSFLFRIAGRWIRYQNRLDAFKILIGFACIRLVPMIFLYAIDMLAIMRDSLWPVTTSLAFTIVLIILWCYRCSFLTCLLLQIEASLKICILSQAILSNYINTAWRLVTTYWSPCKGIFRMVQYHRKLTGRDSMTLSLSRYMRTCPYEYSSNHYGLCALARISEHKLSTL